MKRRIIISVASFVCISFWSCTKQLNQQPIATILATNFWKTANDAASGNAAIYAGLQNTFSNTFTEWGDARSDNFTNGGTGENQVNVSINGLDASTVASADWGNLYNTIDRCNLAIKYLPNTCYFDSVQANKISRGSLLNYQAQALTVRAFMYFWAVRLWGDVPVRLIPIESQDSIRPLGRSNQDSVVANVINSDLSLALYDMQQISPQPRNPYFVSQGAILAIQAEVAMWQASRAIKLGNSPTQYYQNAINYTNKIMHLGQYNLVSDPTVYKDAFVSEATAENIWSLDWNFILDGKNGIGTKLGSTGNTSNYVIDTSTDFFHGYWMTNPTKLASGYTDIRQNIIYDNVTYASGTIPKAVWKYYPIDPNTGVPVVPPREQNQVRLPFYRYADIYLMQAEASNALGDTATALKNVRAVRNRAQAGPIVTSAYNNFTTIDALGVNSDVRNAILDERQLELFGEGKRWFDLLRNNTANTGYMLITLMDRYVKARKKKLNLTPTGFSGLQASKLLWPISRTALIDADGPNETYPIVQNYPYSN